MDNKYLEKMESLSDLANSFNQSGENYNNFYGQIFSTLVSFSEDITQYLHNDTTSLGSPDNHPARLIFGDLSTLLENKIDVFLSNNGENLEMHSVIGKFTAPKFTYVGIISPFEKTNGGSSYTKAHASINYVKSMFTMPFGHNLTNHFMGDFEFDKTGQLSFSSRAIRRPSQAESTLLLEGNILKEISKKLSTQQQSLREKFQRCCTFLSNSFEQKDESFRFSAHWIAMEIFVGGTSNAIRSKLAKSYNIKEKEVDDKLRFREISRIRHDLIHKGIFTNKKISRKNYALLFLGFGNI